MVFDITSRKMLDSSVGMESHFSWALALAPNHQLHVFPSTIIWVGWSIPVYTSIDNHTITYIHILTVFTVGDILSHIYIHNICIWVVLGYISAYFS